MAEPYIFRVIREKVDGLTVRVLLEPYSVAQIASLSEGDEFVTGTLNFSPWVETEDSDGETS